MLQMELAGQPFIKSHRNAALQQLIDRSHASIEFKHGNISAVLERLGFPEGLTLNIPAADYANDPRAQAIAAAAARLNELRENWLNPADLVVREPEVVPGYPDRILPRDEAAAKELKKRTLTNLYNARPQWLANAHAALDTAVADAYGWAEDWRAGRLDEDEILARLFALNQSRSTETS